MKTLPQKRIGVLVGQLGTPDEPTPSALRRYLNQFLSDRRVIDYHPILWQPILQGIILRTRPRRSAQLYQRIWTEKGSPLRVYSKAQVSGLQERLGDSFRVILGMRYGSPSIESAIQTLEAEGIDQMIVLPMFPQFSSTTTASIYDAVYNTAAGRNPIKNKRFIPTLRFVAPYFDDAGYIEAMRSRLQATIASLDHTPDKYVITFHGIPKRYIDTGDPYRAQCAQTAYRLAEAMGWDDDEWLFCFQSRFGSEEWLTPYTEEVLESLHQSGVKYPLVFSPGFVTDCLETLSELGLEGQEHYERGGGRTENYTLAPCLNDDPLWLDVLAEMVRQNAAGWTSVLDSFSFSRQSAMQP